jgi:hypothetical protein
LEESSSRRIHVKDSALPFQTFGSVDKSSFITGRVVGIVVPSESGWVIEKIGRLPEERVAPQHEPYTVMCLKVEDLQEGPARRESLPAPSSQCVIGWLHVEERKPVGAISGEGPEKSLLL